MSQEAVGREPKVIDPIKEITKVRSQMRLEQQFKP
jgi:hypothetical protein